MAEFTVTIPTFRGWPLDAVAELLIGDEGAANLAQSAGRYVGPAWGSGEWGAGAWGGRTKVVSSQRVFPNGVNDIGGWGSGQWGAPGYSWGASGGGDWGWGDGVWGQFAWGAVPTPVVIFNHTYLPGASGIEAQLPVGVQIRDGAGNVSDLIETLAQLADAPRGVRNLQASPGTNPGEVDLTWTQSPSLAA